MLKQLYKNAMWTHCFQIAAEWDREGANLTKEWRRLEKYVPQSDSDRQYIEEHRKQFNDPSVTHYPLFLFRIKCQIVSEAHRKLLVDRIRHELQFLSAEGIRRVGGREHHLYSVKDIDRLELFLKAVESAPIGVELV